MKERGKEVNKAKAKDCAVDIDDHVNVDSKYADEKAKSDGCDCVYQFRDVNHSFLGLVQAHHAEESLPK